MASTLDKPCVASEQDRVALGSLVGVGLGKKRIERLLNYVVELCYQYWPSVGFLAVHRQLNRTARRSLGWSVTTNNQILHDTKE